MWLPHLAKLHMLLGHLQTDSLSVFFPVTPSIDGLLELICPIYPLVYCLLKAGALQRMIDMLSKPSQTSPPPQTPELFCARCYSSAHTVALQLDVLLLICQINLNGVLGCSWCSWHGFCRLRRMGVSWSPKLLFLLTPGAREEMVGEAVVCQGHS